MVQTMQAHDTVRQTRIVGVIVVVARYHRARPSRIAHSFEIVSRVCVSVYPIESNFQIV